MAENEAVFPIRYPRTPRASPKVSRNWSDFERRCKRTKSRSPACKRQWRGLKLDPDVQAFQRMQDELKSLARKKKRRQKVQGIDRATRQTRGRGRRRQEDCRTRKETGGSFRRRQKHPIAYARRQEGAWRNSKRSPRFSNSRIWASLSKTRGKTCRKPKRKYLALGGDMTKNGDKVKAASTSFTEGADMAGGGIGGLKSKFRSPQSPWPRWSSSPPL